MGMFDSVRAVSADPEVREITQPDGTKIRLRLRGDEYFSWHETADGYVVAKDSADGYWKYAQPVSGRAEFRTVANGRVGSATPVRLGLRKHALPDRVVLRAHVIAARRALQGESVELTTTNANAGGAPGSQTGGTVHPLISVSGTKTFKNIVILACFSNHWDDVNGTVLSPYGRVDTNEYYALYNQTGYTNDGASGSVKDYYREVSYGKLTMDSVVTMWVRLPRESAYYGEGAHGGHPGTMVADAIEAAAAQGFDFSVGDSDGDGWVDCLDILHSGYGEEATGDPNDVWSVKGAMSSIVTKNGVKMYNYHEEPALRGASGTGIERIGTICHETGHFFGLPDLYDYSSLTDGLGNWCIMGGGSWNGSSGTSPSHFSAWCKLFLGFAKATPLHSKSGMNLSRVEDNAVVGMLRDGTTNSEYFLIENRAKFGFDNSFQINPGLLIYHVDNKNANNDLGTWPHPAVKVEEADGNDSNGEGSGGSQAGDAWTITSGLAGGWSDQTGSTNTSAMLYQAGSLYTRTDNVSSYSYNAINSFSAVGSNMTFNVQTLRTVAASQLSPSPDYTVSWAGCSGATQYEIQEGRQTTNTSFNDGAESEDRMYDNWHVAGKTMCVVTNASHGESACYAMLQANYGAVQSLTLRKPFKVTASTVITFYMMSHISSGNGFLKCEVSSDNGDTWKTLGTYSGYINTWSNCTYNATALNTAGVSTGAACLLRFLVDIEYASGWSSFPSFGFAVDDISITGTEIAGCGNWATLDNNVTTTNYSVTGKPDGVYAYRVQAYANGAWQGYGTEGETTVALRPVATIIAPTNEAPFTEPATFDIIATVVTNNTTVGNVRFYSGNTLLQTFAAPPYSYTLSDVAAGNYTLTAQVDYNGGNISTSAPVNVTVNYQPPTVANDSTNTTQNTPVAVSVLVNDSDPYGPLGISAVTQPSRGTASISGTKVIYTPNNYTYGADNFTYTATNIYGMSGTATVSVSTVFPNYSSTYSNAVLSAGPVACWRLNESTGAAQALDMVGGYNGTNNGSLVPGANGPTAPMWPGFESANTAYSFSGSATSISLPALNLSSNITLTAWVKPNADPGYYPGIISWNNGSGTIISIGFGNHTPQMSYMRNGYVYSSSSLLVPTNQWSFVAFVATPTNAVIYLATNSTLITYTTGTINPALSSFTSTAYLGYNPNYGRYNGAMDEVAIFNQALNSSQINGLMTAALTGLPTLVLTSPMDGSSFHAASNILLAASVTTNGNHTVEKVQFLTNSVLIGEAVSAPYQFNWSNAPAGSYAVTAKLLYDGGSELTSALSGITVTNSAPAIGSVGSLVRLSSGSATLNFTGTSGHSYEIQRSTNLMSGFITIWTTNAPEGGGFEFTDDFSDLGFKPDGAYYRLRWMP